MHSTSTPRHHQTRAPPAPPTPPEATVDGIGKATRDPPQTGSLAQRQQHTACLHHTYIYYIPLGTVVGNQGHRLTSPQAASHKPQTEAFGLAQIFLCRQSHIAISETGSARAARSTLGNYVKQSGRIVMSIHSRSFSISDAKIPLFFVPPTPLFHETGKSGKIHTSGVETTHYRDESKQKGTRHTTLRTFTYAESRHQTDLGTPFKRHSQSRPLFPLCSPLSAHPLRSRSPPLPLPFPSGRCTIVVLLLYYRCTIVLMFSIVQR